MPRPTYLPNLLSALRIVLAPAMLGAAYSNSKTGFTVLLGLLLLSDALDGAFARAWRAESLLGRRLDRWGDGLTMVLGALGVFFLWPAAVEREWEYCLAAVTGYLLVGLERLAAPAERCAPTRWWCKLAAWAVPLSLAPWLMEWTPWPFRAAAALQLIMGTGRFLAASARRRRAVDESDPGAMSLPVEGGAAGNA